MSYINDVMRVELSLPAHIMLSVLIAGANCADPGIYGTPVEWMNFNHKLNSDPEFAKSYATFLKTKDLLMQACNEAIEDVSPVKKQISLLRRIERVHTLMVEPYVKDDNADPRKIGIIAFYLIQHLVDTHTIIVPEDSAFGEALSYMLPALSPWEGSTPAEVQEYEKINRSARKQVRKILFHLQEEGFYRGIYLPDFQENQAA